MRREIRRRNYSYRTEQAYIRWVRRFIRFHGTVHPATLSEADVTKYLNYLATERNVAGGTQNQALSAIVFLYKQVLGKDSLALDGISRAKKPKKLPVVLSKTEMIRLFEGLEGLPLLACELLYGGGLRISECLRLRIKDLYFDYRQLWVRSGKGNKDRATMMPEKAIPKLKAQAQKVQVLHKKDLSQGYGKTILPKALARKYPGEASRLRWQYVFPSPRHSTDPRSGITHRYHISNSYIQRSLKKAARKAKIQKKIKFLYNLVMGIPRYR